MAAALDWDDLRFLLALDRRRKLSAASEDLRVTQSTVGRRLARLESCLGVRLMDRTPQGYVATAVAQRLLEEVERLELGVLSIMRIAGRSDPRLHGIVRVACVGLVANQMLMPRLPALHLEHPDIAIELSEDTHNLSLPMRQADIGLRFVRPSQNEVIVRKIGNVDFGIYASSEYLSRWRASGRATHALIIPNDDVELTTQLQWLLTAAGPNKIVLKTNSYSAQISCAINGGGIACLPCFDAERHNELRRVSTHGGPPPAANLFLTVHRDSRDTARFRIVMAWIVETVRKALTSARCASQQAAIDLARGGDDAPRFSCDSSAGTATSRAAIRLRESAQDFSSEARCGDR